jgi:carbon-monoxide dehydrogenase small subunit
MQININVNGKSISTDVEADMLLIDFLRSHGCYSVKRGCETGNCGACTVFMDDKPVLSCGVLAARADGHNIVTLEGMQDEALEFADYLAAQGADQCGFCNPGYVMNAMAMFRENPAPTDEEILEYMSGNLCRCSGYESQLRGIKAYLNYKSKKGAVTNGK